MKRNLIFAFLLAIFLLQGTMAAIGVDAALLPQQSKELATQPSAQGQSDMEDADGMTVSSTIEELSDYAVLAHPNSSTRNRAADPAAAPLFFLSIVPLTAKPPPRA